MHIDSQAGQYAFEAELLASSILYVSNGIEFPRCYGGPMFFADKMGLENVYAGIVKYRDVHGVRWEPSLLLKSFSERNRKLSDLNIL